MSTKDPNATYQPIPSLGHELGILFGFAALMVLCMIGYWIGWGGKSFLLRLQFLGKPRLHFCSMFCHEALMLTRVSIAYQKKVAKMEGDRRAVLLQTDLYSDEKYDEKENLRGQTEYREDVTSSD